MTLKRSRKLDIITRIDEEAEDYLKERKRIEIAAELIRKKIAVELIRASIRALVQSQSS